MRLNFLTENKNRIAEVHEFIEEWNSDSEFILVKTSGSTGTPKEIQLSKKHMISSATMTGEFLQLKKDDSALLCLSPSTIAGKMMLVRSIVIGLELTIGDTKGNPLNGINRHFDFVAMVPLQLENSIKNEAKALSDVSKIIVGGGIVSEELNQHILDLPCEVYHTFGMTETISHIAMRNLSKGEIEFKALPNVQFELENDCLTINAQNLGVNNLITNDIVKLNSPTSFEWKGRNDFVINSGGVKIHPEEIEQKLSGIIESPFFIIGLDDTKFGSKVVLCVESAKNLELAKPQFQLLLGLFQIPKEIYYFSAFARTTSDKVNRYKTINSISSAEKQVL